MACISGEQGVRIRRRRIDRARICVEHEFHVPDECARHARNAAGVDHAASRRRARCIRERRPAVCTTAPRANGGRRGTTGYRAAMRIVATAVALPVARRVALAVCLTTASCGTPSCIAASTRWPRPVFSR
jgi:hypothetical protein